MICMVYRGDGFRGLVDYLASKEGSRLLETNLDGLSAQSFARQVGEIRQLHPKEHLAQPVCHIPLRPAPGEDLSDEQWNQVLQLTLERMGFASSPYVAYLHDHGDGRHLHIATYRVTFEGKLVSDSNDRFRVMAVAREIEQAYGLSVASAKHPIHLTRPALERLLRDPDRAKALAAIRRAVDQAAAKHDTVRAFLTELHRLGVVAEIKVARKSGALQGIRFALPDGNWIKGSDLGKDYSLARICNRHELRLDRRPEGRYLAVSEVSDKEYRALRDDGLAPDQFVRFGSRRTLFWELPQDDAAGFVDLIATRLPHRFLHFPDELPVALKVEPDLGKRALQVRLLLDLVEAGPGIAPALPLPAEIRYDEPPAGAAVRCQELSGALAGEVELPPSSAAALRAEYHEAMIAALSRSPLPEEAARDHEELGPQPFALRSTSHPEVEPAQFSALGHQSIPGEIEPAQFSRPPRIEPALALSHLEPSIPRSAGSEERDLIASSRYERDGSLVAFQEWARLQQGLRQGTQEPRRPSAAASRTARTTALQVVIEDLRAAHRQFAADPSEENRAEIARRQAAYEALAQRIERHRSPREAPPRAGKPVDLEALKTDLLAAHDRYLSDPTQENEADWRRARRRYEAAISEQRPTRPQPVAAGTATAMARETAVGQGLKKRLHEEESRFLAAPHDAPARERWLGAVTALRESEDRLAAATKQHLAELKRELRQSASTLAFYEQAYFRSPSALTERFWRRAEQAHLRSSLLYERARLRLTARQEPLPRQERPAVAATASLTRIFEKQLLGQDDGEAHSLARRAARHAWAHTPLGRTVLAAAHPLRTIAHTSPAAAVLADAVGTSSEVLRRSLVVYAELRAVHDRFRTNDLPRRKRDLAHGDFSSRSLAAAVIRHRIVERPHTPVSLPDAVRSSRSAEAALVRSYRSFSKGLVAEPQLAAAAARALTARAAVTAELHQALGIPSYQDFTAVLGSRQGRALSAWIGTLQRTGLSVRAVASSLVEVVPVALTSTAAAFAVVGARRLIRWVADPLRTRALEILREQNEQRR